MNFNFLSPVSDSVLAHAELLSAQALGQKLKIHSNQNGIPDDRHYSSAGRRSGTKLSGVYRLCTVVCLGGTDTVVHGPVPEARLA